MDVKLMAFDLDGTLLNEEKQISKRSYNALEAAGKAGIEIVPATGRLYKGLPAELKALPFLRYVIAGNGAAVLEEPGDKLIYQADLSLEMADRILSYLEGFPVLYCCFSKNRALINRIFYEQMERYMPNPYIRKQMLAMYEPVEDFRRKLWEKGGDIQKIQLLFQDLELRKKMLEELPELFSGIAVSSSLENNIEINHKNANKGAGLKALCSHLGITLSECMAFGDGTNDISMLKMAGIGIAMGNAEMAVKRIADHVALTNVKDGVAVEIERILRIGETI